MELPIKLTYKNNNNYIMPSKIISFYNKDEGLL